MARVVNIDDDLVVISTNGQVIRMFADAIPHKGRPAQGVAVMNMKGGDEVASIARIPRTDKSGKMISDEELEVLTEDDVCVERQRTGKLPFSAKPTHPSGVVRVKNNKTGSCPICSYAFDRRNSRYWSTTNKGKRNPIWGSFFFDTLRSRIMG